MSAKKNDLKITEKRNKKMNGQFPVEDSDGDNFDLSYFDFSDEEIDEEEEMEEEIKSVGKSINKRKNNGGKKMQRDLRGLNNNGEGAKLKSFLGQAIYWLSTVNYQQFESEICSKVIGQDAVKTITACIYNHIECLVKRIPSNSNLLLAAPSGSGKTETYRVLKEYFAKNIPAFPIVQVDMTSITEEGFKGKNTADVVKQLLDLPGCQGEGLVFLDEIDKKMIPSYTSSGSNVNQAVMAQLLTTIEGTIITRDRENISIDTNRTMFIGLGSFDVCRKKRNNKDSVVGFGAAAEQANKKKEHFEPITREDMLQLGASSEFIGRFLTILNYKPLKEESINKIIDMYVGRIEARLGINIEISSKFRRELLEFANSNYGCRMLETRIMEPIFPLMGAVLSEDFRERFTIVINDNYKASLSRRNVNHSA